LLANVIELEDGVKGDNKAIKPKERIIPITERRLGLFNGAPGHRELLIAPDVARLCAPKINIYASGIVQLEVHVVYLLRKTCAMMMKTSGIGCSIKYSLAMRIF
jgi:hypothetical protein